MDLTKPATEGRVKLVGEARYREVSVAARTCTVHLVLRVSLTSEDVRSWSHTLPGLPEAYNLGTTSEDSDRFKYEWLPDGSRSHLTVQLLNERTTGGEGGAELVERTSLLQQLASDEVVAEVVSVRGRLTRKAQWIDVALQVPKLPVESVPELMLGLASDLVLQLPDAGQLDLFAERPDQVPSDGAPVVDEKGETSSPAPGTEAPRYLCAVCEKTVAATRDGTLRKHKDPSTGRTCDGSGVVPSPSALIR